MNRLHRLTGEDDTGGDKKSGADRQGEGPRSDAIRALRERIDAVLSFDEVQEPVSFPTVLTIQTGEAWVSLR